MSQECHPPGSRHSRTKGALHGRRRIFHCRSENGPRKFRKAGDRGNRETPKDESQQNYEDESNISKTNGEELVNINSELLGSTPFDIQIDKTALQTRKETETEVTIKTNLTDWGYTVSSEKGKISDINKNSFIYIAPKDERDDTIKIQLSDYENGISYEYTIPLIFAGNNEHSLDKFKENLSRLPNS